MRFDFKHGINGVTASSLLLPLQPVAQTDQLQLPSSTVHLAKAIPLLPKQTIPISFIGLAVVIADSVRMQSQL